MPVFTLSLHTTCTAIRRSKYTEKKQTDDSYLQRMT